MLRPRLTADVWRGSLPPVSSLLVAGLLVRFALAPFTSWPHDDAVWYQASVSGQHHLDLYARAQFPYPPVWGTLLEGLGELLRLAGLQSSSLVSTDPSFARLDSVTQSFSSLITSPVFNVAFKSLLFLFDAGTAFLLLHLVRRLTGSEERARLAFALWFLNPFVIFESAIFGAFDTLVAFFCIATVVLVLLHRSFWAGVALGMGILAKVSPLFLVPFVAGAVVGMHRGERWRESGDALRHLLLLAGGLLTACAVYVGPEVANGSLGDLLHSTFARTQTDLNVGGVSFFGVRSFRWLGWLPAWASDHAGAVTGLTTLLTVAVSLLAMPVAARLARRQPAYVLLAGTSILLGLVLLVQPLTQPQYVLWLLPEALAVMVVWGIGRWQAATLSIAPVVYVFSLISPIAVLAPLAQWTGMLSPRDLVDRSLAWYTASTRLWGTDFAGNFRSLASVGAVGGLAWLVVAMVRQRPPDDSPVPAAPPGDAAVAPLPPAGRASSPSLPPRVAVAAIAGTLVLSSASVAAAYRPPPLPSPQGSMQVLSADRHAATVSLRLQLRPGPAEQHLRLLALPLLGELPPPRSVRVFVDPHYPGPDSNPRAVQGVYDHLRAELRVRGDDRSVEAVDEPQAVALLSDLSQAPSRMLVMTTGVMPADLFSREVDLVTPWIQAGGTLVWGGDAIGYYSEYATRDFDPDGAEHVRDDGPVRILGPGIVERGKRAGRTGAVPSAIAEALGLEYDSTAVGISEATESGRGARLLGYTGDGASSLTEIPVGIGSVIVFGGDTYDENPIAHDLGMLLLSHVLDTRQRLTFEDVDMATTGDGTTVTWSVDAGETAGPVLVEAFDPDPDGVFFTRTVVDPPPAS